MNTTAQISARLTFLINFCGYTVKEAVDKVLGEGTYETLANEVYDELRKDAA